MGLRIAFSDRFLYQLPAGHRFPISKYELVKEQLLYEGIIEPDQIKDPGLSGVEILLAHSKEYYHNILNYRLSKSELRKLGIPLHERSVGRALNSVAGTLQSAKWALSEGLGINIGGGYHHAHYRHGEGFCIFNDLAVTARYLQRNKLAGKILIADLDVHQGNGTASILANDTSIFTFSMHADHNYPIRKETSDLDLALNDGIDDEKYLTILDRAINTILDQFIPDFVLYQAGVDVLGSDQLGRLKLSMEGCKERDRRIIDMARILKVPLVITLGGGYSEKVNDIIKAHTNTIKIACDTLL